MVALQGHHVNYCRALTHTLTNTHDREILMMLTIQLSTS